MALLATLAAHDLGFIDTDELVDADRRDADDRRRPGALRGPPAELVRHAHAGAAAAGLRLHGRQRQPRRRAADAVAGCAAARRADDAVEPPLDQLPRAPRLVRRHELQLPLRPAAAAVRHRLSSRRRRGAGPPRPVVLRPARSEARLASFLAIAKGDVPESHWFHLGRAGDQRPRRAGAAVVERARCSST